MKRLLLIIMPLLLATSGARADILAQAIWCASNSTLYFDYCETVTAGSTYSGQQVTKVYTVPTTTYAQTPDLGWQYDGVNNVATTVVFTEAFKNFKPTSCLGWFKKFESLTTITGLSNLDTSEVTDMSYMFQACKLVTLDVNTFNVNQVTDASGMFLDCDQLTTIYCNQTWSIANSSSMFENCRQLKGAVSYDLGFNTNDELANPINGYFTASLTLSDDASNADYLITYNECYGNITLNGRTLYKDGSWNTLCLPFNLKLSGSILDDEKVELKTLVGASVKEGVLSLNFEDAEEIKAGVPYIIRWDNTGSHIVNPVFKGVTISSTDPEAVTSEDGVVRFAGNYSPVVIAKSGDRTKLYIGADNTLSYPKISFNIGAFHSYFQLGKGLVISSIGDVNNDRSIDVTDVTLLVNYILGNVNSSFIVDNADVNGDGEITVADVTSLVNNILNGNKGSNICNVKVTGAKGITFRYGGSGPARVAGNHFQDE